MRPVHLLLSDDGFMLIRIRSLLCSPKPHRLVPHCSMRTLPLLSAVCHRPSGVVGSAAGGARSATGCWAGGALLATGAGAAGAALAAGAGGAGGAAGAVSVVVFDGSPEMRSRDATGAGAGGAAGARAAGAGGAAAGAGAGGGAFEATSSSSDFLPFRLRFFRLTDEPLLVIEMKD